VKNIDTKALENFLKKPPNASFQHLCNPQIIKHLQNMKAKGAFLDFKRALVRPQKGTFSKPIRRLLEAKRASFKKRVVNLFYINHKNYKSHNSVLIKLCNIFIQIVAPY